MPTLTIYPNSSPQQSIPVTCGETLLSAVQRAGVEMSCPCGGQHSCGKCRLWAGGALSLPDEKELALLPDAATPPPPGFSLRLACFTLVRGDCQIRLLPTAGGDCIAVSGESAVFPLAPIYEPGDGDFGAAVDIGTTTVVVYLYEREQTQPLAVLGQLNCQQTYGADVLSRIDYCNRQGLDGPRDAIRGQLAAMLTRLCTENRLPPQRLAALSVTGNTTMLHLLAGLPPASLALAPFTPLSLFGSWQSWALPGFPQARIYTPPCISAYVGADITCAMLAADLLGQPRHTLLVDAGTNGEMALWSDGRLLCCSTAAGPAFEGAGISAGMTAQDGAIDRVWAINGQLHYSTIGQRPAVGLCGSGLIDAIAAMLELELIDKSGRMDKGCQGRVIIGDSGVAVTQGDVRQLQLAKGAIRAGMDTLLHEAGLEYTDLARILLCGGFGSYLSPARAERIGLLPPGLASRSRALGNAAGLGAASILQSRAALDAAQAIAGLAQAVELSYSPFFRDRYLQTLGF